MAQVIIRNINQGGLSDSDYTGTENSVAECVGLDIHSEAGLIKCNQALVKDSSTVVDEFCRARVSCSNGSTYFFGESGGIFERESNGTWTDRGTAAPAAGSAKILGAEEYQGYIYYFMQSRVGRIAVPSAGGSWAGRNDSWETFTNTDADFHPSAIVNEVLYIGDKNYVAQVDGTTFSANALDLKTPLRISALGKHAPTFSSVPTSPRTFAKHRFFDGTHGRSHTALPTRFPKWESSPSSIPTTS